MSATPLPVNGHSLHPRASVGVAATDDPLTDPEQLLHQADTAMYASKRRGHAGVHVYGEDLDRSERRRLDT